MTQHVPQNLHAICSVMVDEADEYSFYWSSICMNNEEVEDEELDAVVCNSTIMDLDGVIHTSPGFTLRQLLDIAIYAEMSRFNLTTQLRKHFRGFILCANGKYVSDWE